MKYRCEDCESIIDTDDDGPINVWAKYGDNDPNYWLLCSRCFKDKGSDRGRGYGKMRCKVDALSFPHGFPFYWKVLEAYVNCVIDGNGYPTGHVRGTRRTVNV